MRTTALSRHRDLHAQTSIAFLVIVFLFLSTVFWTDELRAAPNVMSDPTTQTVTHCGYMLDAQPKVDVPVATDAAGKFCKMDIANMPAGNHTIRATYVNIDPLWGRQESVPSLPLAVTKPSAPLAPLGLSVSP